MGLLTPSVLKEYRKRAEAAIKVTKAKNDTLIAKLDLCVPILDDYKKARAAYQALFTAFGPPKYDAIVSGQEPLRPSEKAAFDAVIAAGDRVEACGDKVTPAQSTLDRAHRELDEAITAEKAAYALVAKYMNDKANMKAMGDEAYKKWKKELRADLFPK
jgi:hypothetical protein